MSRIKTYDFFLFIEAYIFIHASKLIILIFPFKKIAPWLGKKDVDLGFHDGNDEFVKRVTTAIKRASARAIHKSKCFDQAIAGCLMLRKRGLPSTIYFGISFEKQKLVAHAWVKSSGIFVIGGEVAKDYKVLLTLSSSSL